MTQATIVLVFLTGLVGIMLWIIGVIALDILHDSHRTRDKREKPPRRSSRMDTNRTMLITSLNSCSLTKGRDGYWSVWSI